MLGVLAGLLAALIVGVVALLLFLLVVPLHIHLSARSIPQFEVVFQLRLFSRRAPALIRITEPVSRRHKNRPQSVAKPRARTAKKARKGTRPLGRAIRRRLPRLIRAAPSLIADTFAGLHLDRLQAHGRIGLDDPAETGQLYGQLCPLIYAPQSKRISLCVTPDFDHRGLAGHMLLEFHFQVVRLAWPTLRLIWRELVWMR